MKLPPFKISTKVRNAGIGMAATTLIVGFVSKSPLKENPWLDPLEDPAVVGAIVSIVGVAAGYQTEEKSVGGSGEGVA